MSQLPSPLLAKIQDLSARVVVVGVGYAGLPLAVEFGRAGFRTVGLDVDSHRVAALKAGRSHVPDVDAKVVSTLAQTGFLDATTDPEVLADADVVVVCVPTPLHKTRDPDIRAILEATDQIARYQHDHMLVILESTSYPGTTRELLAPKLTTNGFTLGQSLFLAFSPERIDPGNHEFGIRNTPKLLGAMTPACLEVASSLYRRIIDQVVPVSSPETAEMAKLWENTFRAVNVALANELALISRKVGVDPFEVVRAAATKPFGFMPFFPGPGLGGHCVPVDPLYLSWRLRSLDCTSRFIELADVVNGSMPAHVLQRLSDALNEQKKPLSGSRILVYGVTYKRDVGDVRESPAIPILHGLLERGAIVAYSDPFVPHLQTELFSQASVASDASYADYDAVVVVTDHQELERERLLREARLVLDTRDALARTPGPRHKLHGL